MTYAAIAVLAVAALLVPPAAAQEESRRWTSDDVRAAQSQASPLASCIIEYEVRGTVPPYNPYAVGAAGELGPVQLHPQGELLAFYRQGYTDPFSPYQAADYLEGAIRQGRASAWSPVLLGLC